MEFFSQYWWCFALVAFFAVVVHLMTEFFLEQRAPRIAHQMALMEAAITDPVLTWICLISAVIGGLAIFLLILSVFASIISFFVSLL